MPLFLVVSFFRSLAGVWAYRLVSDVGHGQLLAGYGNFNFDILGILIQNGCEARRVADPLGLTYGDQPRDQWYIRRGIEWYDARYGQ